MSAWDNSKVIISSWLCFFLFFLLWRCWLAGDWRRIRILISIDCNACWLVKKFWQDIMIWRYFASYSAFWRAIVNEEIYCKFSMNESSFLELGTKIVSILKLVRLQLSCKREASGLNTHLEGFSYLKCESYWFFNGTWMENRFLEKNENILCAYRILVVQVMERSGY